MDSLFRVMCCFLFWLLSKTIILGVGSLLRLCKRHFFQAKQKSSILRTVAYLSSSPLWLTLCTRLKLRLNANNRATLYEQYMSHHLVCSNTNFTHVSYVILLFFLSENGFAFVRHLVCTNINL